MRRTDQRLEFLFQTALAYFRTGCVHAPQEGVVFLKSATLVDTGTLGLAAESVAKYVQPQPFQTVITNDPGCGSALWSDVTFVTRISSTQKRSSDYYLVTRLRLRPRLGSSNGSIRLPPIALPIGMEEEILRSISEQPHCPKEFLSAAMRHLSEHQAAARSLDRGLSKVLELQKKYSWKDYIEFSRSNHLRELEDLPLGQFRLNRDLGPWGRLALEIRSSGTGVTFGFEGSELHPDLSLTAPMTSGVCLTALNGFFRVQRPITLGHLQNITVETPQRSALDGRISSLTPMGPLIFANILANSIVELLSRTVKSSSIGEPGFSLSISAQFEDDSLLFDLLPGGSGGSAQLSGANGLDVWTRLSLQPSIEELERHFPITVIRHERRPQSGGRGQFAGGDGLRRTYRFEQAAQVSWLPAMTKLKADGFSGGSQGDACQLNLTRSDGTEVLELPSQFEVKKGDLLTLLSGGGGGFGKPDGK